MEIKNLKEAAKRILEAVEKQEKILLYGDSDLDGVCSTIILKETIESLGGKISCVYFPDREKEGYGISSLALNSLKKFAPALFISLDCGISNFAEIELAKNLGFEVIIVDHHEVLDELPKADLIVNPKQKGDFYPFKGLATAGIVFKLAQEILTDKLSEKMRENLQELAALATIADLMPLERENKILVDEGIELMKRSFRPAFLVIQKFFQIPKDFPKINSILNVRYLQGSFPASFLFLTQDSEKEAEKILQDLIKRWKERHQEIERVLKELEEKIQRDEKIIFVGSENFDFSILPAIASRLCQAFQKPTFVFKKGEKESQGTVRSPQTVNTVKLMKKCANFLISFGGHPQASGFRIKNENLEAFKKCLLDNL